MKNIIIFGANSGMAEALARELAKPDTHLVLVGRNLENLETLKSDLTTISSSSAEIYQLDFLQYELFEESLEKFFKKLKVVDLIVIAHGFLGDQTQSENDSLHLNKILQTNFNSPLLLSMISAKYLEMQKSGHLLVFSSVAGDRGRRSNYSYGACKAGLSTFLEGLSYRLRPNGVFLTIVKPGFVDTAMTAHLKKNFLFANPQQVAKQIVKRLKNKDLIIYTPSFWRWIMMMIKLIPISIMRKLKF